MQSKQERLDSSCSISWPERMVRRLAGSLIVTSLLLAWLVSPWWLVLTAFVGLNLLQSSFTSFCPAEMLFRHMEARRQAHPTAASR
jgi:hypothetical protein